MLKVGIAKLDVTPPVGARMAGFAGRVFPSLAVHDPLWARAVIFDDGKQRIGLVQMDLIGVWETTAAKVREGAAKSAGVVPSGLMLSGTHTHSGPTFWDDGTFTEGEKAYWAGQGKSPVRVEMANGKTVWFGADPGSEEAGAGMIAATHKTTVTTWAVLR